jgi:dolichyl-phosphate beta-glucosyltransferase
MPLPPAFDALNPDMIDLSIVIPAYNEESRILPTLESVHTFLSGHFPKFEIIVVNDGSNDSTSQVVTDFAKHHQSVRLVAYDVNKGKGHAVRVGMLAAGGDLILMNDADGSSPISEVLRLRDAMLNGADIVIGSRAKPDPHRVVKALAYRTYMGNTFNGIVQWLLLPGLHDTQCGFKLFKRPVAHDVFSCSRIDGFAFDVEVLFIARRRNYKIVEIAIDWTNVNGSKVNVLVDSAKMLLQVIKIKINDLGGQYRRKAKVEGVGKVACGEQVIQS